MFRKWSCSYTVEAAFIVPIVVWILALLIFYSLYQRDIVTAKAILTKVTEEGKQLVIYDAYPGSNKVLYEVKLEGGYFTRLTKDYEIGQEKAILSYLQTELINRFLVCRADKLVVDISDETLRLSVTLDTDTKTGSGFRFLSQTMFRQTLSEDTVLIENTNRNRIVAAVLKTGRQIKGVKEIEKILNKALKLIGK